MKRTISSGSGSVGRRSLLGAAALAAAAGVQSTRTAAGATNSPPMNRHLLVDDRISDLLQHPAFAGFARLLLPGGSVTADPEVPLRDIGSLMPYHSRVHPPEVVAALNRLIDDTRSGQAVFHDIYTAAEKRRDPSLEATGLFFLRGRPGAPFALVAPGGGFSYVATLHGLRLHALQGKQKGKPQPDSSLRDTENVPYKDDVAEYFQREVLPHAPDAWIDPDKTKVGYEIPFNRHFYVFKPPRPLAEIDADLKASTDRILEMIKGLSA